MKWHIIGAGAIGSIWAHKLKEAGEEVCLILRDSKQAQAFEAQNSTLTLMTNNQPTCHRFECELANQSSDPISHLLITTKAYASLDAFQTVYDRLTNDSEVVILINGMGPQQTIADLCLSNNVYAASTTDGAYRSGSFTFTKAGNGITTLGPLNKNLSQPRLMLVDKTLRYSNNISDILWQKLAINGCINPLTVIHDCNNGQLTTPPLQQKMKEVAEEIEWLCERSNQTLFDKPLYEIACQVASATAENLSSMRQDIMANRKTEIEEITGYILAQGKRSGLRLACNEELYAAIKQREAHSR